MGLMSIRDESPLAGPVTLQHQRFQYTFRDFRKSEIVIEEKLLEDGPGDLGLRRVMAVRFSTRSKVCADPDMMFPFRPVSCA